MERLDGDRKLAIVAGPLPGGGQAASLAKAATAREDDARTRPPSDGRDFGEDWYTSPCAQTSGEIRQAGQLGAFALSALVTKWSGSASRRPRRRKRKLWERVRHRLKAHSLVVNELSTHSYIVECGVV